MLLIFPPVNPMSTRELFEAALYRAQFFRWCAAKGHELPGNDPQTGRSRSKLYAFNALGMQSRRECRAAYKAMALEACKLMKQTNVPILLP